MSDLDRGSHFVFRAPSLPGDPPNSDFKVPSTDYFHGTWYVTHSTLPMWKNNRNVRITYKPLAGSPEKLDDLVEYQNLKGEKLKCVCGVDTPEPGVPLSYHWRGKGMLMIASSHWQVLGYGPEEEGWAVTYFAKTLFTPAGIDIYSRAKAGISDALVQNIREGLKKVDHIGCKTLEEGIFVVKHD